MHFTPVKCPACGSTKVSKNGTSRGDKKQRYICNNSDCFKKSFMLEYSSIGWTHGIEAKIITNTANAQGIRDIARSLGVSKQKVQDTLKKHKDS